MKFAMRWLVAGALVGVCVLAWGSNVGRDVVGAQGSSKPAVMKRIYTGTDGLSHVEDIVLDAKSVMEKVTSVEVRVGPPGRFGDWHVGPQRQYIINLAGSGQLEVAEGKVDLPPGSMEYIDDLTGKGHTTRTTSKEERVSIWLKFEDQKQRIGPLNSNTELRFGLPDSGIPYSIVKMVLFRRRTDLLENCHFRTHKGDLVAHPGLRVRLRISEGHDQLQGVSIHASVALLEVHLVTVRVTEMIEPGSVVITIGLNNEYVSLPPANRVSVPGRIRILRKCSPIRPDGAPQVMKLHVLQHPVRSLDELKWSQIRRP